MPASAFTQRLDRLPRLKTRGIRSFAVTLERRQQADTTRRSAADEVIADAGFCVDPTVDALAERLDVAVLGGARPPTSPAEHARTYDWDAIAEQAETAYRRAIDGSW